MSYKFLRYDAGNIRTIAARNSHTNFSINLLIVWEFLTELSKRIPMPGKLFFSDHHPVPLCCTYLLCTRGHRNILLIEDLARLRAQKHKPTMVSAASPRAANPKMVESPASMAHASSSYACAEDGYFKCPHPTIIGGDMRWDSGWVLGGFGVGDHWTRN